MSATVNRSYTKVVKNSLPKQFLGQWVSDWWSMDVVVKPPVDKKNIMVGVRPAFSVLDAQSRKELFRFETETTFEFEAKFSKRTTLYFIYSCINMAIDDFNVEFKKSGSTFSIHRQYDKETFEEMQPQIEAAYNLNTAKNVPITPFWRKSVQDGDIVSDNASHLLQLPAIPEIKKFNAEHTQEQMALNALFANKASAEDEHIVREAISFYKICFTELKRVNLFTLKENEATKLIDYLKQVFNFHFLMFNDLEFSVLTRASYVHDGFLEDGKVRDSKYLTYPPLELNKQRGVYNRANSCNTTMFYATPYEHVALREVKPKINDRLIITDWEYVSDKPFVYFPISMVTEVENELVDSSTLAMELMAEKGHPLVVELMELFFLFLSSEFIKEPQIINERKYEYLYSAFFAEKILNSKRENGEFAFDAIVYPSVAWDHIHDNLAIIPDSVDKKLRLRKAKEIVITSVFYDRKLKKMDIPVAYDIIRESSQVAGSRIIWNDD